MWGRYVRRADKQRISEAFEAGEAKDFAFQLQSSYNIAPQSMQPVVRWSADIDRRELALMRWGLVPSWSRDAKAGYSTINARAETITTSRIFQDAIRRRRCLVPADAFYEWKKTGAKTTQPYAIGRKDSGIFVFAGLWERWNDKIAGQRLETFTIITTHANELMRTFHDRMPVIIPRRDYERWLAPSDPARLPVDLLRPYPAEEMTAWKVDSRVGNTRNDDDAFLLRVTADDTPVSGRLNSTAAGRCLF